MINEEQEKELREQGILPNEDGSWTLVVEEPAERSFIECLKELLNMPAAYVEVIEYNKCKVVIDGVGEFVLDIKCIEDFRGL